MRFVRPYKHAFPHWAFPARPITSRRFSGYATVVQTMPQSWQAKASPLSSAPPSKLNLYHFSVPGTKAIASRVLRPFTDKRPAVTFGDLHFGHSAILRGCEV